MSKAFRIPTVDEDGFQKKIRYYRERNPYITFKATEIYQAFNLPIIKGNPFVKVNAN